MDAQMMQRTQATVAEAAKHGDTCLLFWSATGKDSIVLLDLLAPHFKKLVLVYLYHVKNLNIVEPFLQWARTYPNTEIVQLPHRDRIRWKKYGTFDVKKMPQLRILDLKDYENHLKRQYSTDVVVYGFKVTDSFVRRGIFNKAAKAEIHTDFGKYYPIVEWSNQDCLNYIMLHNLPHPLKLGSKRPSSGVNLREETVLFIKEHYPLDYQKIIKDYPLIEARYGSK